MTTVMHTLLLTIVCGALLISVGVTIAAAIGWLRRANR